MTDTAQRQPIHLRVAVLLAALLFAGCATGSTADADRRVDDPPRDPATPPPMRPETAQLLDRSIDLAVAGDHEAAYEAARQAYRRAPHRLEVQIAWVEALLALGRRAEALDAAEIAVQDHPRDAPAHYALGRAYMARGLRPEALHAFEAAASLAPDDLPTLVALLSAHLQLQGHDDEVDELSDLLRDKAPNDPYVLLNLAVVADARGDTPSALALYRQAIAAAPTHPIAHYDLARLLEREQGFEAARAEYEAFVREAEPGARRLVDKVRKRLEEEKP